GRRAGLSPGLAAVVGPLDDLAKPAARLRHVDPVRVGGRSFHVVDLPAGEVRALDVPLLTLAVGCQDERALARPDEDSHATHSNLLADAREQAGQAQIWMIYVVNAIYKVPGTDGQEGSLLRSSSMPRGRPRTFDVDQALDAALLLFWRHGYEGTSLTALTRAMELNAPSLYAAFGDKEALFRKALDRYIQDPASYLRKALAEPTAWAVAEKALAGAIRMVMHPRHPDGCLLVHGALASHPSADPIRKELGMRRAAAEAAVRKRFERAVVEGDLSPTVDPGRLARYLMTVIWGLSVQAAGGMKRAKLKEVAEFALRSWPLSETSAATSSSGSSSPS